MELVIQPRAIASSIEFIVLAALQLPNRAHPIDPEQRRSNDQIGSEPFTSHHRTWTFLHLFLSGGTGHTPRHHQTHPRCGGVMQDKGIGSLLVSV